MKNPADVLASALARPRLESRLVEALPWLLLRYPDLDADWLVGRARALNLTNRLGFLADLARQVAERKREACASQHAAPTVLASRLGASRLVTEDTFGQDSLGERERAWLRENRPARPFIGTC